MTVERYNTPNHPRWSSRTNAPTAGTSASHRQQENPSSRRAGPEDAPPRSPQPMFESRETTQDDATLELRNTSERVCISTELPDRSLDEIRVSVRGASIRVRAEPSDESPRQNGIDRTLTFARAIDPADVVVAYDDPTLAIIVPYDDR